MDTEQPLPATSEIPHNDDFPHNNRLIFQFLSAIGFAALEYDRHTNRIVCPSGARNRAMLIIIVHVTHSLSAFGLIQLSWLENASNYLSSLADTVRSFAIVYSYESLMLVALLHRHRFAAYFNQLRTVDGLLRSQLGARPDAGAVQRHFWMFSVVMLCTYLCCSFPLGCCVLGIELPQAFFLIEYMMMAISVGWYAVFLRYVSHCCLVRYACLRCRLCEALGSCGSVHDVRMVMFVLDELDEARAMLQDGFGSLLMCKLGIDGVNVIFCVYLMVFKMIHYGPWNGSFLDFVVYEWPYVFADVYMVRIYHHIGDEVRNMLC